jgi:hypothetical protein
MCPSPLQLALSSDERVELRRIIRRPMQFNGVATRARIVLLFDGGTPIKRIAASLFLRREVVRMWLERFIKDRLEGLYDLPRSGRPPTFSPGSGVADGENRLRVAG